MTVMLTEARCPLCGASGEVRSLGAFGWVAHCSDCYDEDPEASREYHLQGHADRADVALELWLEAARECAAIDEIPALVCRHRPVTLVILDVLEQALTEFARQKRDGWHLVDVVEFDWVDGERIEREAQYLETDCA